MLERVHNELHDPETRRAILLVDHEPRVPLTLAAILRHSNFDITVAATVAEALHETNTSTSMLLFQT
jgi:DNA-binding response OmpR family regulator